MGKRHIRFFGFRHSPLVNVWSGFKKSLLLILLQSWRNVKAQKTATLRNQGQAISRRVQEEIQEVDPISIVDPQIAGADA